jgi:hypothetical protein
MQDSTPALHSLPHIIYLYGRQFASIVEASTEVTIAGPILNQVPGHKDATG